MKWGIPQQNMAADGRRAGREESENRSKAIRAEGGGLKWWKTGQRQGKVIGREDGRWERGKSNNLNGKGTRNSSRNECEPT